MVLSQWELAIDIGAATVAAAHTTAPGVVQVLPLGHASDTMPAGVMHTDTGIEVGFAAQHNALANPDRYVADPIRWMPHGSYPIGDCSYPLAPALEQIIAAVVAAGQRHHNGQLPARIVVTHPVEWADDEVLRLVAATRQVVPEEVAVDTVAEPVAACAKYCADHSCVVGTTLAIFDCGAGSLDVAVVKITDSGTSVLAARGDRSLGGRSFDALLAAWVHNQLAADVVDASASSPMAAPRLQQEITNAKELLSTTAETTLTLARVPTNTPLQLSREELETVLAPAVRRAGRLLQETLDDAQPGGDAVVDAVLLVGGSTLIPLVRNHVEQLQPVVRFDDPMSVGVCGALQRSAAQQPPPATTAAFADVPLLQYESTNPGDQQREDDQAEDQRLREGTAAQCSQASATAVHTKTPGLSPNPVPPPAVAYHTGDGLGSAPAEPLTHHMPGSASTSQLSGQSSPPAGQTPAAGLSFGAAASSQTLHTPSPRAATARPGPSTPLRTMVDQLRIAQQQEATTTSRNWFVASSVVLLLCVLLAIAVVGYQHAQDRAESAASPPAPLSTPNPLLAGLVPLWDPAALHDVVVSRIDQRYLANPAQFAALEETFSHLPPGFAYRLGGCLTLADVDPANPIVHTTAGIFALDPAPLSHLPAASEAAIPAERQLLCRMNLAGFASETVTITVDRVTMLEALVAAEQSAERFAIRRGGHTSRPVADPTNLHQSAQTIDVDTARLTGPLPPDASILFFAHQRWQVVLPVTDTVIFPAWLQDESPQDQLKTLRSIGL
ncbi:Hsp70 family protein [Corynebacterium choanae]|uniref:Chaperone protein DnaK n=1 Tax=Corynebacterium choanae TaxID=1862358 RepID=A0A3G6J5F4_9CORY|nr:Hsp70 family protein [Corynebacterium choanae]AZA13102.1 Chaperone protein DnaK [Corynebacterium choanae]